MNTNFGHAMILIGVGIASVAVAGFLPRGDDIGKMLVTFAFSTASALVGSGLTLLRGAGPGERVVIGGERVGDRPTSGSHRQLDDKRGDSIG